MSVRLKNFPEGKWRVLFGGHVRLGSAPIPEHVYLVPIQELKRQPAKIRFVQAGLGDLPFLTPCSKFDNGIRVDNDRHPSQEIEIKVGSNPLNHERELSQALSKFTPTSDPWEYFDSLKKSVQQYPTLSKAPVVAFRECKSDRLLIAPAAEWYRLMYGRQSYLAHTFLQGSTHEIIDRLVVSELTGMVRRNSVTLTRSVVTHEELLGIVPREKVNDEFAPLIASIMMNSEALRNARYAGQMIRSKAASGEKSEHWLRFGHPFPGQPMTVRARGIRGAIVVDDGSFQKRYEAFFCTSLLGHSPPVLPPHFIIRRENDGRPASEEDENQSLTAPDLCLSEFLVRPASTDEPIDDLDHPRTDTPRLNPAAGGQASIHMGAPFDSMGAPRPAKQERKGRPSELKLRPIEIDDIENEWDEVTTNQISTTTGEAAPASARSRSELQDEFGLSMTLLTLQQMNETGEVSDLQSIDFRPSEYSLLGITLQRPASKNKLQTKKNGWASVRGRTCPRLTLAISFIFADELFLVLDQERKNGNERFRFLLAKYPSYLATNPSDLRQTVKSVIDDVHRAKGVFKNVDLKSHFQQHLLLQHSADKYGESTGVRKPYLVSKLTQLAKESS